MKSNILRLPEVQKMTGLSRSSIYAMMDKKSFPENVSIGDRAVGWLEQEIQDWIHQRIKRRQKN